MSILVAPCYNKIIESAYEIISKGEKMKNVEIREILRKRRIFNYEVAQQLGITEFTFCRWLREEFSVERRKLVLEAIDELTIESERVGDICSR